MSDVFVARSGTPEAAIADFVCDGTADQVEINAAIATAAAGGGGTVHIAAGTYSTTAPVLVVNDNIHLEGAGDGGTVIELAANWRGGAHANGAELSGSITFCAVDDFSCRGITVDAVTHQVQANGIIAIADGRFGAGEVCTNGTFADNEVYLIQSHTYSIWTLRSQNMTITGNTVDGGATLANSATGMEGIEVYGGSNVLIANNVVRGIGNAAINLGGLADATPDCDVQGVTVRDNVLEASRIGVNLGTTYGAVGGAQDLREVTITGNQMSLITEFGVQLRNYTGSTTDAPSVSDLTISNNQIDMAVPDGPGPLAAAIWFYNSTAAGATQFDAVSVSGNTLTQTHTAAVYPFFNLPPWSHSALFFYATPNVLVSANHVVSADPAPDSIGLYVHSSGNFTVDGNVIDGAGRAALYAYNSPNLLIRENQLLNFNQDGQSASGLQLEANTALTVLGNELATASATPGTSIINIAPASAQNLVDNNVYTSAVNAQLVDSYVEGLKLTGSAVVGTGNAIDNTITGNALDNVLDGRGGNDVLDGGAGNDTLTGGSGNDRFVYAAGGGADILTDFVAGVASADTVDLSAIAGMYALSSVLARATQSGANTVIDFGAGSSLTLQKVSASALIGSDFIFAPNAAPTDITLSATTVPENSAGGTIVGTLGASDADAGETLTFSLQDSAGGRFGVNGTDLVVTGALDHEASASWAIVVRVTDVAGHAFDKAFTVDVSNVEQGIILVSDGGGDTASRVAAENTTAVTQVTALDENPGATIVYAIAGGADQGLFQIDPASGVLAFVAAPDFESPADADRDNSYVVTVSASDGVVSDAQTITVNVTDIAPVLTGDGAANVIDGTSENDTLYGLGGNDTLNGGASSDVLVGGSGADRLEGGAGNDCARYDTAAGAIVADLLAPASNSGDAAGDTYVSIEGLYGTSFNDVLIGDNAANTLTGADGSDLVYGRAGNDILRGGNGGDQLDGGAGADTIDGGAGFDYARYGTAATGVVVDIVNAAANTGDAAGDQLVCVEGVVGSSFGDSIYGDDLGNDLVGLDGADAIFGRGGSDGLQGGNGNDTLDGGGGSDTLTGGAGDDRFVYGPGGGADLVTDFMAGAASGDRVDVSALPGLYVLANVLSRATQSGANVVMSFGAGNALTLANVSVSSLTADDFVYTPNSAPTDITLSAATVAENAAAGTVIGVLAGVDADASETLTLALQDSAGGRFALDGSNLVVAGALDHEASASLTVSVRVTDIAGHTFDKPFAITIGDVNEAPTGLSVVPAAVPEDSPAGTLAGALVAIDPDAGETFTWLLTDDAGGRFAVDGQNLVTTMPLDAEAGASYNVTLQVTDSAGHALAQSVSVAVTDVNEAPTHIALSSADIAENGAAGAVVGVLSASDADPGETFAWSLVDDAGHRFAVSGNNLVATMPLDHEASSTWNVTIRVTDSAAHTLDRAFTIGVTNVNEAPLISSDGGGDAASRGVSENTGAVTTVVAADPDAGTSLVYSISGGADAGLFQIGSATGALAFKSAPDYETPADADRNNAYIVTVSVSDGTLSDTQTLTVNVADVAPIVNGDNGANTLSGSAENDTLSGLGGNDVLNGLAGDDMLVGGIGADRLDGGAGFDTARYDTAAAALRADLLTPGSNSGDAAGDTYIGIEALLGTAFNDVVAGDNAANRLSGLDGADYLYGRGGADALQAGGGNDQVDGGAGADVLDGGDGYDYAAYSTAASGVTVSLANPASNSGDAAGDQYLAIEGIIGTSFADTISGDSAGNDLAGLDGNDTINGREGADGLQGGNGVDTLDGGAGADLLVGGAGFDTFLFRRGEAAGDTISDFAGNGPSAGDQLVFQGYGTAAQGATLTQINATRWSINSSDGAVHELLVLSNSAPVHPGDYTFV